jgi:hypothetical protein
LRHPEGVPIARADVEGAELLRIGADGATVHLKPQGDRIQLRAEFE